MKVSNVDDQLENELYRVHRGKRVQIYLVPI